MRIPKDKAMVTETYNELHDLSITNIQDFVYYLTNASRPALHVLSKHDCPVTEIEPNIEEVDGELKITKDQVENLLADYDPNKNDFVIPVLMKSFNRTDNPEEVVEFKNNYYQGIDDISVEDVCEHCSDIYRYTFVSVDSEGIRSNGVWFGYQDNLRKCMEQIGITDEYYAQQAEEAQEKLELLEMRVSELVSE